MADFTHGQTLLGSSGGFEGSFTIDNSTLATNGGADTWQKGNANQTITLETTTVRSGVNSLKILNASTTGRRVYTPLLASVADGSRLVLQYYRRRPTGTGQEDQRGIAFPPESTSGTYSSASAVDTWEKVTYVPTATTTNGNKWAAILHRLVTTGDNTLPEYLDDVAVYIANSVDNTVPDAPTTPTMTVASSTSLTVSWTPPGTGVDNGGYLVVRGTTDPTTAPNVNGIYVFSNTVTAGQPVVYSGSNTSFTDTNLLTGTNYFYRIYTVDKAFNYSSAISTNGTPAAPSSPIITTQPSSRTNNANTLATFTVTATGADSYRWFNGSTAYTNSTSVAGATTSTLSLSNVFALAATTNLTVVLSNIYGSTTSAPVTLMVIDPYITTQPSNQSVIGGTNATFSVVAIGTATLNYQWQHAGTNLPGATNTTLIVTNVIALKAGAYQVLVSNAYGTNTSTVAALTIVQSAFSLLTYNVKGNFSTDWSTNAVQVQAIGRQVMYLNPDIITFNEIPLDETAQMTNFVTAFLPGYYMATNSSSDGFIRSVICSRYPINRSQSYFGTVATGSSLTNYGYDGNYTRDLFEAEINVPNFSQPLHVFTTHLKSGQATDDTAKRAAETTVISNYFATGFLTTNSAHPYLITGDWNEDVNRPPSGPPKVLSNLTNTTVGFRLTTPVNPITGDDKTHSIQNTNGLAKRYDYILPSGLLYSNIVSSQVFRTDLLTNPPAPLLTNDAATASDHLPVLMVFNNPYAPSAPTILNQPQNQTNNQGATTTFTVTANGTAPLGYQWLRDGTNLVDGGNISGVTNSTLTLTSATTNDANNYLVIVTNDLGSVTSSVVSLTIIVPPTIITQPASQTNIVGGTAGFNVVVSGTLPFAYQWKKGSASLSNGGNISGATSDALILSNLVAGDATNYTVIITNPAGAVTSSIAALTVISPPSITTPPTGRTIKVGELFTLTVSASSTVSMTHQWLLNGSPISSATNNTYTNTSAQATDGGAYSVVVSNQAGAVTSSVANVIVALTSAPFYPANLVVLRAGDGVQTLGGGGNSIYIDQFTTNGVRVNTIGIPDTNVNATLLAPNSTSEGWLARSANGLAFTFGGYNTNLNAVASLSGSTASAVPRVIGVLNVTGQYSIGGKTVSAYSTANIRAGLTDGTNNFWGAGSASGTYYFGSNAAAATVQSTVANTRVLRSFNGGLFFSTGSGTRGLYALNGLPTTSSTPTNMIPTGASSSPYDFAINTNVTIAYVADDSSLASGGGIQKWTNNVGTWSLAYTLTNAGSVRGLCVDFSGSNPILYATTTETSSNRLVCLTDTNANASAMTLVTAGVNQVFRGLDFSTTSTINLKVRTTSVMHPATNTMQATFTGAPTYQYVVQVSTNLLGGWTDVQTNVVDTSGTWSFSYPQATNVSQFYRVIRR